LLNGAGEVVGITTQKRFLSDDGRPLQGIGFALSSNDLLVVLRRFYPDIAYESNPRPENRGKGTVSITSNKDGAEIYIDGKFVGDTPTTFTLLSGPHNIEVKGQDGSGWQRELEVLQDSEIKLNAVLQAGLNQTVAQTAVRQEKSSQPLTIPAPDTVNSSENSTAEDKSSPRDLAKPQQDPSTAQVPETVSAGSPENISPVSFTSDPSGAEVYVDDSHVGKTPMTLKLKPGQHAFRMFMNSYQNWVQWITIEAGAEAHVKATLTKSNE
jgi:hypothetical protein